MKDYITLAYIYTGSNKIAGEITISRSKLLDDIQQILDSGGVVTRKDKFQFMKMSHVKCLHVERVRELDDVMELIDDHHNVWEVKNRRVM